MTSKEQLLPLETYIDIEKLICEVQERPALWDMTQNDYTDRIKRKQCWEEITQIFGSDLSLDNKKKLGDLLHKKWKNIRDRFARDIQERKGKSRKGGRKKAPYMYAHQLEFLRDTVALKGTVSSSERTRVEATTVQEDQYEDDEEEELQEAASASSVRSSVPNVPQTQVTRAGKKGLQHVEDKILHLLDRYENREDMYKAKESFEDNDDRHFLLSLVHNLKSLPRHLNTSCRIEIMQCIHKYENMSQQYQQAYGGSELPTTSYLRHHQYQQQQQQEPHFFQPIHHRQMYVRNQSASGMTRKTPSPAESTVSYYSTFMDEDDSTE